MENLCRCCHSPYGLKSLGSFQAYEGVGETYSAILKDTFNIVIQPFVGASSAVSYSICDVCVAHLRDASTFKQQVVTCEQILSSYCDKQDLKGPASMGNVVKEEMTELVTGTNCIIFITFSVS
ncbi:unnamed protein product, partial [Iphiclides podalirius]